MGSEPMTAELNQCGCGMSDVNAAEQAISPAKFRAGGAALLVTISLLPVPSATRPKTLSFGSAQAPALSTH
jgi:hypothetical protein